MKVLYRGHFREGSGWSNAAIDQVLALVEAGVEVVCRDLKLTETNADPGGLITELEKGDEVGCSHCIQYVLPHHIAGSNLFQKNVAYFIGETDLNYWHSWLDNLELVDEVWVPNSSMEYNFRTLGYTVKKIPCSFDISKYSTLYPEISIPQIDHTFKFYTIADLNERKNLESLIKCFHHTFWPDEDVSLILKVKKFGFNQHNLTEYVKNMCNQIKADMRMYPNIGSYHPEVIIAGHTPVDQVLSLHQYGDCFVNLSHGEGWSIPTFDAMAIGNYVIASQVAGHNEYGYIGGDRFKLIQTYSQICQCRDGAFPELFTGRDFWQEVDDLEVCKAMREFYEERIEKQKLKYSELEPFSHRSVGESMKNLLLQKQERGEYEIINS